VIVQKEPGATQVESSVMDLGGTVTKNLSIINAFTADMRAKIIPELAKVHGIRWVSFDAPVVKSNLPWPLINYVDDSDLINTYDFNVKANKVWTKTVSGQEQPWLQGDGVGVAVLDSGINQQQDLYTTRGSNRIVGSTSFASGWSGTTPWDDNGHGTHVAGIIGGNGNASDGNYIGIAPMANLINVKVSDNNGVSNASSVVQGLQWVLNNKSTYNIRVVNLSFNSSMPGSYNTDAMAAACEILWFNGIVVVTSAGNKGSEGIYPPANDPFVITVGAVDEKGSKTPGDGKMSAATFSAYGTDEMGGIKPDLVAPGTNIISLLASPNDVLALQHGANVVNSSYFKMSGTSLSAPIVSGAVALLLQSEPNLNPDQVKYRLMSTALQKNSRGSWDTRAKWTTYNSKKAGSGMLDIEAAVNNKLMGTTPNKGKPQSAIINSDGAVWTSANWSSANWSSANWSSANWSSANWSSTYWGNK